MFLCSFLNDWPLHHSFKFAKHFSHPVSHSVLQAAFWGGYHHAYFSHEKTKVHRHMYKLPHNPTAREEQSQLGGEAFQISPQILWYVPLLLTVFDAQAAHCTSHLGRKRRSVESQRRTKASCWKPCESATSPSILQPRLRLKMSPSVRTTQLSCSQTPIPRNHEMRNVCCFNVMGGTCYEPIDNWYTRK